MPFVPCLCTSCGAPLTVDDTKDAAVCKYCGTPFIIEKAINNYKTINITMEAKDEKALVRKGLRMIETPYFDKDELAGLADDLSNLSTNDFYPELFFFAADAKENQDWLLKNADEEGKKLLAKVCFNGIIRDYNKESFDEIKLNIAKNYSGYNFDNIEHDKTCRCIHVLGKLTGSFDTEMNKNFEKMKEMAASELEEIITHLNDVELSITAIGYARGFTPIVDESTKSRVEDCVSEFAKRASSSKPEELYQLAKMTGNDDVFHVTLSDDFELKMDKLVYKGRAYPASYALKFSNDGDFVQMLLQLDDTTATVIKLNTNAIDIHLQRFMPNLTRESLSYFDRLTDYKSEKIEGSPLKLVYQEGISYRKSKIGKLFGFLGSFLN